MRFSVLLQIPHKNITLFTFQKPAVPPFCKWRDCWFPEEENAHENPFPACVAAATTPPLSAKEPKQTQWDVQTWNSAQRSFFLYEKSGLRESDSLRGRKPEVCTDLTPTLSALNLSKLQVPRGFNPLGRGLGTASPRSCPSTTQKFQTGV